MIVLYFTGTLFVIVPREEPQTQTDGKPTKTTSSQFYTLVNYEGRGQNRASRLHFRAPTLRNHRYLRGLIFQISKNPNEIITFMLKIAKTQTKSALLCWKSQKPTRSHQICVENSKNPTEISKIMGEFLFRLLNPQIGHKDHPT